MNVQQLIEKLSVLDPEMMVVVDGYEGGVKEAFDVDIEVLALNVHEEWYYGNHEALGVHDLQRYADKQKAPAVRIY